MEKELTRIYEELDLMKFKLDLLFTDSELDRILFEHNITKTQNEELMSLIEKYSLDIEGGKEVCSSVFESEVFEIVPQIRRDYHFAESLLELLWDEGRWEEVFVKLYGDSQKFKDKINK